MENKIDAAERRRTLDQDHQYFGSYLNQARHNIYNINNGIAEKLGAAKLAGEEQIANCFFVEPTNNIVVQYEGKIYALLKRFMPIAKVFDTENLPRLEQERRAGDISLHTGRDFHSLGITLKTVFKELGRLRNDYTHAYSLTRKLEKNKTVLPELSAFLNDSYKRAVEYTKERFVNVLKDEDFAQLAAINLFESDNIISQDGMVFLTCMFLDRETSIQLMSKVVGLKGTQYRSFIAKREVMMAYCIKQPHDKFVSDDPAQALSLDIINELNKCPDTLFYILEEDSRKQFLPNISNIENVLRQSVPEEVEDYESYISDITKRVRYENRFYYFALRYIDQQNILGNYRFQIDLGKLILDKYPKQLSDGTTHPRLVTKRAKAFSRLQDIADETQALNKIYKDDAAFYGFEQFAPHYNIYNNKIGVALHDSFPEAESKDGEKVFFKQPIVTAFLSVHELQKIILLEYLDKGKAQELISQFVRFNKAVMFNRENFIEKIKKQLNFDGTFQRKSAGKKGSSYNRKEKVELAERVKRLDELLGEYACNSKQVPSRILDYWLDITNTKKAITVKESLKDILRDCKNRIKQIASNRHPKIGEMATYVARDIVSMVVDKEQKKKKITSFYYNKIQECLALFEDNVRKDSLCSILEKDLGLYETGGHPFLSRIDLKKMRYTKDIYSTYLTAKKSYIERNFYKKKKGKTFVELPNDGTPIPYSIKRLDKETQNIQKWLDNVSKGRMKPVDLPTNLFDEAIRSNLAKKLGDQQLPVDQHAKYNELFKSWWKEVRQDDIQPFYQSQRCYTFQIGDQSETLSFLPNTKRNYKDYIDNQLVSRICTIKNQERANKRKQERLSPRQMPDLETKDIKKTIKNRISSTEKELRILQEQDRIMILIFEALVGADLGTKLVQIQQAHAGIIQARHTFNGRLSFDETGAFLQGGDYVIHRTIIEERKRKEASVLRKFSYDKRLPELFEYFEGDTVSSAELKTELNNYIKIKDLVYDDMFRLEKAIMGMEESAAEVITLAGNGMSHIQHHIYLDWLLNVQHINENEYRFMKMVRNTFSHNQYPQRKTMEIFISQWNTNKWAEQIYGVYHEMIGGVMGKLKGQ